MMRFVLFVVAFWLIASTAHAEPITATIAAISAWYATASAIAVAIANLAISTVLSIATSALQKAFAKKPLPPGLKIERTLTGGAVARRILMGWFATAGSEVAPPMSHGNAGKTPNAYFTKVIALADVPITALTRVIVNGEYMPILTGSVGEYGYALGGKVNGHAWIKFYDGNQNAVDPMLLSRYGGYIRPWSASSIGQGVAYVILTFKYNTDLFKGEPDCRFELQGMKLYDPRVEAVVFTENPIVMIYNILRGIDLGGGFRWGGECEAEDLPLSNWIAAMNVCDELVAGQYGNEPRYRAGYEIDVVEDEPATIIEELMKCASASIVEVGGRYRIRCGPPSLPVAFVTDGDIIVSKEQDFDPFPEVNKSFNSISATYPSPAENWNVHDAPPHRVQEYVDIDDGIENPAVLQMPACPYPIQVQRNMKAWLEDDRRWRQHTQTFGPYAWAIEPLDCIAWTSNRNGYVAKLFEVDSCDEDLVTLAKRVQLREVDPSDYDWSGDDMRDDPVTPGEWYLPLSQAVPGWSLQPWSIKDADGDDRRPALRAAWDTEGAEDATAIKIEVRLAGTVDLIADVTVVQVTDGVTVISEGILPSTAYEARARYIVDRATHWSSWLPATTADITFGEKDGVGVPRFPDGSAPIWNYDELSQLPVPPLEGQENAFVKETEKLYFWDAVAGEWKPSVADAVIDDGTLTNAKFVAGLRAPGLGNALPALPSPDWPVGSQFVLTTNGKIHTNVAGVWKTGVAAADIDGAIQAAQVAGVNAAAVIGQMVAAQLANGSVVSDKIAANAVVAGKIAAGAVVAGNIVAGAINTEHLAAGAVVASKMFVGDTANIFPDPNLTDPGIWSGDAVTQGLFFHGRTTVAEGSEYLIAIEPSATGRSVFSTAMVVEPNATYRVSAAASFQGTAQATGGRVYIVWYSLNASGVESVIGSAVDVSGLITSASPTRFGVQVVAPTNARRMRVQLSRFGGNGVRLNLYGPVIRRASTGELIVDGAITTDKLAANSVVAGTIAAGAINASHIGAKVITTSKLAVGDYSNLVNDNFSDSAAWIPSGSGSSVYETGNALDDGRRTWRWTVNRTGLASQAYVGENRSGPFSVQGGSTINLSAKLRVTAAAAGHFRLQLVLFDANGVDIGYPEAGRVDTDGTAKTVTLQRNLTLPDNAVTAQVYLRVGANSAGVHTTGAYYSDIVARRAASGELIVDGSIVTGKLAANAVTSDKIVAGAVVAAKINVTDLSAISANLGVVTAGMMRSGTGGNRTEVDTNGVRVYVGGTLRAIMGQW